MGEHEVSVRELRQNLSVHLRRVQRGETLAVTSRGVRVALLAPLGGGSRLDRLVAEGRISAPEAPWEDLVPVSVDRGGRRLTELLLDERGEQDR